MRTSNLPSIFFFDASEIADQTCLGQKDAFSKVEEKYLHSRKVNQSVFLIVFIDKKYDGVLPTSDEEESISAHVLSVTWFFMSHQSP